MSAVHRIDDIWSMEAGKFFRFARRLPAYQGVMRGIAEQQAEQEHRRTGGRKVIPVPAGKAAGGLPAELAPHIEHGYATDTG